MLMRRLNPRSPFVDLDHLINGLFSEFNPLAGLSASRGYPALSVWETPDDVRVEAELPGLSMNDVEIFVAGDELTIKGQRRGLELENVTYHRRERGVGEFSRAITLPAAIDADRVAATLRDGVLTITLPKAPAAKARKVAVVASTN